MQNFHMYLVDIFHKYPKYETDASQVPILSLSLSLSLISIQCCDKVLGTFETILQSDDAFKIT